MNEISKTNLISLFQNSTLKVVAIDADDTLWYDRRYFRRLRKDLLKIAHEYNVPSQHIKNIIAREFERPVAGESEYAVRINHIGVLAGLNLEGMNRLNDAIDCFLSHPVEVLPLVFECLNRMRKWTRILVTCGSYSEQVRKINVSGLVGMFDQIEVLGRKSELQWRNILFDADRLPSNCIVIGNSLEQDIIPVTNLGVNSIWLNHSENSNKGTGELPLNVLETPDWTDIYTALQTECE